MSPSRPRSTLPIGSWLTSQMTRSRFCSRSTTWSLWWRRDLAMTTRNDRHAAPDSPARDARFTVVDTWRECANFPDEDPRKIMEFMHRQMNEEMDATECSARTITDFPDAPWELRMFLAR